MGGEEELTRRKFLKILVATASVMGAAGAVASAIPFIRAMEPSKGILASGRTEVDISDLKEGGFKKVVWRKSPVFILRRTSRMIRTTEETDPSELADPATVSERSYRPDIFVGIGICTHLGCVPRFMPDRLPKGEEPGFYCLCHGGLYDTLGRRLGGPPPENLHLLPYKIVDDRTLILGTEAFGGYGEDARTITQLPEAR
ncbi:MAG: ubiquinol-cytochrome c reductase iron-sulfur subunit [Deltaproteobacteria bacterium]|nr:ubiquinol-cytochrome c reductase iron-sulfur subunit [Deltaproteobacteria bacterium]